MHRANEATEKYRSLGEDDFSAAERASAAGAYGHLSFPTATERGITQEVKIVRSIFRICNQSSF